MIDFIKDADCTKETSFEQLESGVVRITIRKQYNNNAFPDDEKEGEK